MEAERLIATLSIMIAGNKSGKTSRSARAENDRWNTIVHQDEIRIDATLVAETTAVEAERETGRETESVPGTLSVTGTDESETELWTESPRTPEKGIGTLRTR
jgi:hypothetical protein